MGIIQAENNTTELLRVSRVFLSINMLPSKFFNLISLKYGFAMG
jgi:hypothetical protein